MAITPAPLHKLIVVLLGTLLWSAGCATDPYVEPGYAQPLHPDDVYDQQVYGGEPFQQEPIYSEPVHQQQAPIVVGAYEPLYYGDALVYYDDVGAPFYFVGSVPYYVPRTYVYFDLLVGHYHTHRHDYHRWRSHHGRHLTHVRPRHPSHVLGRDHAYHGPPVRYRDRHAARPSYSPREYTTSPREWRDRGPRTLPSAPGVRPSMPDARPRVRSPATVEPRAPVRLGPRDTSGPRVHRSESSTPPVHRVMPGRSAPSVRRAPAPVPAPQPANSPRQGGPSRRR